MINDSIIASFEKNPDMNGIPINAIDDKPRIDIGIGNEENIDPMWRISW